MTMPELARVLHCVQTRDVAAGEVILREGETTENLFMVVAGAVRVLRGGQTMADLGAGSHFGEMALLNQRPRTATVVARMPTRLLVLERPSFFQLAMSEPVIAAKFLWKLAQTLSLRLDDVYLLQDRGAEPPLATNAVEIQGETTRAPRDLETPRPDGGPRDASAPAEPFDPRATARFGTFPSPFAPRG
jgi:CRP-like cAMP-binding protein